MLPHLRTINLQVTRAAAGASKAAGEDVAEERTLADDPAMRQRRFTARRAAAAEAVAMAKKTVQNKQAALDTLVGKPRTKVETIAKANQALKEARVWRPAHNRSAPMYLAYDVHSSTTSRVLPSPAIGGVV